MTVIALAIETNFCLNNAVERYDTPEEAVQRFIKDLVLEEGEVITMLLASVLIDETTSAEEAQLFAQAVERTFEATVPEWFAEGYFGDESEPV